MLTKYKHSIAKDLDVNPWLVAEELARQQLVFLFLVDADLVFIFTHELNFHSGLIFYYSMIYPHLVKMN